MLVASCGNYISGFDLPAMLWSRQVPIWASAGVNCQTAASAVQAILAVGLVGNQRRGRGGFGAEGVRRFSSIEVATQVAQTGVDGDGDIGNALRPLRCFAVGRLAVAPAGGARLRALSVVRKLLSFEFIVGVVVAADAHTGGVAQGDQCGVVGRATGRRSRTAPRWGLHLPAARGRRGFGNSANGRPLRR